jgi:two-component system, chemotaxis family, protein-glutamate methylesterase/glutaminase
MRRDTIVLGASAGGVEALRTAASLMPPDFPAALLVVLHVPPFGSSALPMIIDRAGPLPASHARDGEPLLPGRFYIAPPDHHLVVLDGFLALTVGPRENGHRPSVDVLFRSAARALGPRVVGVVLSGSLDDGTAGLLAIGQRGGVTVVQDPPDALHVGMPRNAIEQVKPDHIVAAAKLPDLLGRLIKEEIADVDVPDVPELMRLETAVAQLDASAIADLDPPGRPSGLTCPDCSGALYQLDEGGLTRFRCRVGHAWSAESLVSRQGTTLEGALWMALRSLEERAALSRRIAASAKEGGRTFTARRFEESAQETKRAAILIRELLQTVVHPDDAEEVPGSEPSA